MDFRRAMGWLDEAVWLRQPADRVAEFREYWEFEQQERRGR